MSVAGSHTPPDGFSRMLHLFPHMVFSPQETWKDRWIHALPVLFSDIANLELMSSTNASSLVLPPTASHVCMVHSGAKPEISTRQSRTFTGIVSGEFVQDIPV